MVQRPLASPGEAPASLPSCSPAFLGLLVLGLTLRPPRLQGQRPRGPASLRLPGRRDLVLPCEMWGAPRLGPQSLPPSPPHARSSGLTWTPAPQGPSACPALYPFPVLCTRPLRPCPPPRLSLGAPFCLTRRTQGPVGSGHARWLLLSPTWDSGWRGLLAPSLWVTPPPGVEAPVGLCQQDVGACSAEFRDRVLGVAAMLAGMTWFLSVSFLTYHCQLTPPPR